MNNQTTLFSIDLTLTIQDGGTMDFAKTPSEHGSSNLSM